MKHFVVGVDWHGPYSRTEASEDAKLYNPSGLYFAIGRVKPNGASEPQYVGLSKALSKRLSNSHKKLDLLEPGARFWLGYISTAEQSGCRAKATPRTLDDAEWCHAFFMDLPLNEKKVGSPPQQKVTVLNRWWTVEGEPRNRRPHKGWPDLFDFMQRDCRSRVVWFGGRQNFFDLGHQDLTTAIDD